VQAESEVVVIPVGAESSLDVAVCPASYTRVARNISSGGTVIQTATRGFAHALNMGQYPAWTVEVATCCRVPGR
jgi:regulator of RNase E activity RraA